MFLGSYPARGRSNHTGLLRVSRARGDPRGHGGNLRWSHALHVQPGRRSQGRPAQWLAWTGTQRRSQACADRLPQLENLVFGNEIFAARTKGVGVLTSEQVMQYGLSGPIARASGVDIDLRRDEPYLAYGELQDTLRVVTAEAGDCLCTVHGSARAGARVARSGRCVCRACSSSSPPGPINQRLPKVLKVPRGVHLRLDREPAGHQRLLPRLARRQDAVPVEAEVSVLQQRPGAQLRCSPVSWLPTWWPSWGRCSSSSETSTSRPAGSTSPDDAPLSWLAAAVRSLTPSDRAAASEGTARCPRCRRSRGRVCADAAATDGLLGRTRQRTLREPMGGASRGRPDRQPAARRKKLMHDGALIGGSLNASRRLLRTPQSTRREVSAVREAARRAALEAGSARGAMSATSCRLSWPRAIRQW